MSGQRIFTTWFTSMADAVDHAVTDEEFAAHRPEPEAICGAVVVLGSLMCPPRAHCPRCTAFLRARQSLPDAREPHRPALPDLLARVLLAVSSRRGRAAPRPPRSRRVPPGGTSS